MTRSALHIRTLKVATGTHFVSFVTRADASGPTLSEELERLPPDSDLVINVGGLGVHAAMDVITVLRSSHRLRESTALIIVVCEDARLYRLFERSGLDRRIRIESSTDDAFRYVLGHGWLRALV